ncbi:MAG TPA: antitoxin MazE-like protein [Stellaceae bacterium]|nr:antitoxin MazE-like protein [Stellaceae bacterium]
MSSQSWDTRSPVFAAEARRQCKLIAESPQAADDQAFIVSLSSPNEG